MTIDKAEALIREYGVVLQKTTHPAVFQTKRALPCSTAKLKFAIMRYMVELNRRDQLQGQQLENMIAAYSYISYFVDDHLVNPLNAIMLQKDDTSRQSSRLKKDYSDIIHYITQQKETLTIEIKEFVLELREYVKN